MLKYLYLNTLLFFSPVLLSQTFNGSALIWNGAENPDARILIKAGTSGINVGGYEGTTLVIKNLTNRKLYITVRQIITDFCGVDLIRNPSFTLLPNETIGGSTFIGGSEQCDFQPACKERKKYADDFYTRISYMKMKLTSIKEDQANSATENPPTKQDEPVAETSYYDFINNKQKGNPAKSPDLPKSDVDFWGNKINSTNQSPPANASQGANYISDQCTPQRMGIAGIIGADCVPLSFMSEKTIQFNSSSNEIRTDNTADNFILSYKRLEDIVWTEKEVFGNQLKYNLVGLDPCTKYEIKIQRNCGNGARSTPMIPIEFNTACPGVSQIQTVSVTPNEIKLRYFLQLNMGTCNNNGINKKIAFEYKSQSDVNWNIAEFNMNTAPILNMLKPNTYYTIRAKVIYPNNKYSTYSTGVSIKTK